MANLCQKYHRRDGRGAVLAVLLVIYFEDWSKFGGAVAAIVATAAVAAAIAASAGAETKTFQVADFFIKLFLVEKRNFF